MSLLVHYLLTSPAAVAAGRGWTQASLWGAFIAGMSIAPHSSAQVVFGVALVGVFVLLFINTLLRGRALPGERSLIFRIWRGPGRASAAPAVLCIVCFIVYLAAPDTFGQGGYIKIRLALFPFLVVLPWLSFDIRGFTGRTVGCGFAMFAAAYIIHFAYLDKVLNDNIAAYTSGCDAIGRNKVILPLGFDYKDESWQIGVLTHVSAHCGYETGGINLINYEAGTTHFPTMFKQTFRRPSVDEVYHHKIDFAAYKDTIDYVMTWAMVPGSSVEGQIAKYYKVIRENGKLKVFERDLERP